MKETTLKVKARTGNAKQVRDAGFIPGVLNASDASSTPIQFEAGPLNKTITQHGSNAKLWVELDGKKMSGYIKEVQRHPVEGKVIHVAVQLVGQEESVKLQLPIAFHGRDELENRQLQLVIHKPDVDVSGKSEDMPDIITVNITGLPTGSAITPASFKLPDGIKLLDAANEIYAVIKPVRRVIEEEPTEAAKA